MLVLIRSVIAGFIIAAIYLLSVPTAAQQATVSDDDFIKLHQQIKELKDPTFRAFLRMRLLGWKSPDHPRMRQAALEVATQGVRDLCEHQDEVWTPTASWLHSSLVNQIKTLQTPEETGADICVLKLETTSEVKNFSSGMRMLRNSETSAAGLDLAKTAILSGQVSDSAMLGQLSSLQMAHSPHVSELLGALLALEEKQPGALTLRLMPFFTSLYFEKSVPSEISTRFVYVAVRSTRLPATELGELTVRSSVGTLLNGIISPAKRFTPELYPEIANRLSSLNPSALSAAESRLAAEERIQKATDQLEQLVAEANTASSDDLKTHFLFRAARMAKERGQFSKAVDLAVKDMNDGGETKFGWVNEFLSEIVSLAIKKNSPQDATYAISKMTRALVKADAFRLLGVYYGSNHDNVKSKEAFSQAGKQLKSVENSIEKVRASVSLAESASKYEPADAFEFFRESVKGINSLPSPEKDQEKMYNLKLLPIAEDLIRSFRFLATVENQTAASLAAEIKLPELRLSALCGTVSE